MPGILPMKVIRVGNNAQSRIAQACDRCRSKKIRCDGIRPHCTHCAKVGFECKTSDKLSRRAFPRGYTESLEDRVKALEGEAREFKDLLDEKDEKIDVLSRIHSFASPSRKRSASASRMSSDPVRSNVDAAKEELVQVEPPVTAQTSNLPSSLSCTSALIDAFMRKASSSGGPFPEIRRESFTPQTRSTSGPLGTLETLLERPPRLLSDQYINIFFQEWAPLLPILHRPQILRMYEEYLASPDAESNDKEAVAQLFLIFDIAALSSRQQVNQILVSYESHWRKAMQTTSVPVSISRLQCHLLAQVYYLLQADYTSGAQHRAIAVSMCHLIGLHHSQKYYVMNPLETETRKKVFWCQYALDKFLSVSSGTPTLLRDSDIDTEYPADVDDENIAEQGLSPALPGELTKISIALALFKICRILSHSLDQLLPVSPYYHFPIQELNSIANELDQWVLSIPAHLRMQFVNDKPSTGVISDRSPLLSLAYFFIRNVIHRRLVCHGSGSAASASLIAIADSAKHMVQILELLEERKMSYAFPISRTEVLLSSGFSLLWQSLELSQSSKLAKDNHKSLRAIVNLLGRDSQGIASEFQRVTHAVVATNKPPASSAQDPGIAMLNFVLGPTSIPAPQLRPRPTRHPLKEIASGFAIGKPHQPGADDAGRRTTVAGIGPFCVSSRYRTSSHLGFYSDDSLPSLSMNSSSTVQTFMDLPSSTVNLDFLPLGNDQIPVTPILPWEEDVRSPGTGWSENVENMDSFIPDVCDGWYKAVLQNQISQSRLDLDVSALTNPQNWLEKEWPVRALDMPARAHVPASRLSTSEGSIKSIGEDFTVSYGRNGSTSSAHTDHADIVSRTFGGTTVPNPDQDAGGLDGSVC